MAYNTCPYLNCRGQNELKARQCATCGRPIRLQKRSAWWPSSPWGRIGIFVLPAVSAIGNLMRGDPWAVLINSPFWYIAQVIVRGVYLLCTHPKHERDDARALENGALTDHTEPSGARTLAWLLGQLIATIILIALIIGIVFVLTG